MKICLFSLFVLAFRESKRNKIPNTLPSFFYAMKKQNKDENYKKLINSGSKWKKIRDAKIKANPLCEICNKELAQEVHHIQPLEDYIHDPETMEQLAYDPSNLQSLCRSCHYNIHR